MMAVNLCKILVYPRRGGQTEVTSDQTSFERTHVVSALGLYGLEKTSSALLSGTCVIKDNNGLIRGNFERFLVWSKDVSNALKSDQKQFLSALKSDQKRIEGTLV